MKQKYQKINKSKLKVLFFTSAFFLVCVVVGLINPTVAKAQDTSSLQGNGMGLLENEWIKVGVNKDRGTFGSGDRDWSQGVAYDDIPTPGLLFDPQGTGNFNPTYDYLSHNNDTSNVPHDGFALKVDGTNKTNNNQTNYFCFMIGGAFCTNEIIGSTSFVDGTNELTWTGSVDVGGGTWTVKNTYSLLAGQKFINIQTSITAGSNAATLYFAKYTDPDPSGVPNDAFNTNINKLGHAGIPSTQIAFAQASVSGYAIGLYSAESNVTAGIELNVDWTSRPDTQADEFNGLPNDYPGSGDDALGLTFSFSNISQGDVLTFCHAYVFGTDFDDAVSGSACTATLTYDLQGGTGQPVDQTSAPASNVQVSSTVPTREGYTFAGWNTSADGSGTDYASEATYPLPTSGTATLYAQWTAVPVNSVTLTYDLQGGTGQPVDQEGDAGSNVQVSSTVPTREGYTFEGWNTEADGSGAGYVSDATYTLPSSGTATLYAQWAPVPVTLATVTLTYDLQGGTGQPVDQEGDAGSNVQVSSTVPTREGYTFAGWNTSADGSGTDYASEATYPLPTSGTATLYAQWAPVPVTLATVTLTYDLQGGTGQPVDQTSAPASNVQVSSTVPTREGYTFAGWNTSADGSGTDYASEATYPLPTSGTATLYAQWTAVPVNSVTLTYDLQGGTGQPVDQEGDAGSNVQVSSTVPTREGYTFEGWNTEADGSGAGYVSDATYTLPTSGTATLYAQWTAGATPEAEPPIPVPLMPALLLLLTSLLLAALGIKRLI